MERLTVWAHTPGNLTFTNLIGWGLIVAFALGVTALFVWAALSN